MRAERINDGGRSDGDRVTFRDVTVVRGGNLILERVSARVPQGSSTAIIGPNGAGKTTLLLAMLNEVAYSGEIRVSRDDDGEDMRIGYVPQRLHFDRGMRLTVLEFMTMGLQRLPFWFGVRAIHRERASGLLASVKLGGLENRAVGALSGGELQRALLALALGRSPRLLVLDEPAAGVDVRGGRMFCELLDDLRDQYGFTQLTVSHDIPTVSHHADHVICLNRSVVAEGVAREVLTKSTLAAVFGVHAGSKTAPTGKPRRRKRRS